MGEIKRYTKLMKSLEYAHDVIQLLEKKGINPIYRDEGSFIIPKSDGSTLVDISEKEICINGESFNGRITPSKKSKLDTSIDMARLEAFMDELVSISDVNVNHFGISYYCADIKTEVDSLKKLVGIGELHEETSGISTTKWLFIGDTNNPSKPLFELILNERSKPVLSSWVPHLQIDIDTTLSAEELKKVIAKQLGADWIKWSIDVEGIGTPLVMGRLCSIDGIKVYLGIGTDKRDRNWHRSEALKKL